MLGLCAITCTAQNKNSQLSSWLKQYLQIVILSKLVSIIPLHYNLMGLQMYPVSDTVGIWMGNVLELWKYQRYDSSRHPDRASSQGNRSTSLWFCTAHTSDCTSGVGCSSPLLHRSYCLMSGGDQWGKNTPPLCWEPHYTDDCSPRSPVSICLGKHKAY